MQSRDSALNRRLCSGLIGEAPCPCDAWQTDAEFVVPGSSYARNIASDTSSGFASGVCPGRRDDRPAGAVAAKPATASFIFNGSGPAGLGMRSSGGNCFNGRSQYHVRGHTQGSVFAQFAISVLQYLRPWRLNGGKSDDAEPSDQLWACPATVSKPSRSRWPITPFISTCAPVSLL